MSTVEATVVDASRRPDRGTCVGCQRPYGRRRAPRHSDAAAALLECADLFVCDQCWHLAGGSGGVQIALLGNEQHDPEIAGDRDLTNGTSELLLQPGLTFPPAVEQLLAAADEYDLLHPIDRLLVASGVRWLVLRHIAVPARMQLAAWVLERTAAEHTAAAPSAVVWLDAVDERMADQVGAEFRYRAKQRRWRAIVVALSTCTDRDGRPLTWITQDEIAAAVGCSTRTVRRCVRWLRAEDLLFEVVPGCRLPEQHVPDGETPTERAARLARLAQAQAAEEAAMARARRELELVRPAPRPAAEQPLVLAEHPELHTPRPPCHIDPGHDLSDPTAALINLAPVYELRVPRPADEPTAAPQRPSTATSTDALTSANTGRSGASSTFVHPPQVLQKDMESSCIQPVDKRRAPRGPHEKLTELITSGMWNTAPAQPRVATGTAPHSPAAPQSEAVEAARWLLHARLDPNLCEGISVHWLTALIRGSGLLKQHGWTWEDLVDLLHGYPEHPHLPRFVRDPRAWIRARFARANPSLPPAKLRIVHDIERNSPLLRQRVREEREQRAAADIAMRRAEIAACALCDEYGWLQIGTAGPLARCTHVTADGGY